MKNIILIAGEVSADNHGAALIREIKKMHSQVHFWGIGGDALSAEGMELLVHLNNMAFLGIGEVIRHLPYISSIRKKILERARSETIDCAILIDYPGFNLRLAPALKKLGIPVVYYISPQLWAWGKRRIHKIKKYVDRMLVLFPFEEKFYKQYGVEATYVGHPIVDHHAEWLPRKTRKFNPKNSVLGLLPGSRTQEVARLLPLMVGAAENLFRDEKIKHAEILQVEHVNEELYLQQTAGRETFLSLSKRPINEALTTYDAALIASGTATLEAGYFKVPMVVVYKVNSLTYWLARILVHLEHIGLVNIVAEKEVAKELIQKDFTVRKTVEALSEILEPERHFQARQALTVIEKKLGPAGASKRAAREILNLIE